jgi:uncharacterized protein (TIGR02001 family)
MKIRVLLTATVLGSLFVSTQALAGASANIGATSNYLWRAQTQSDGHPAIQGGLDYAADNGLYVGTWASNEEFVQASGDKKKGTELDLYAGYKKELKNGLSYDVGAVKYGYPNNNANEFSEAYLKLGYKGVGFEYDNTIQTKDATLNAKGDQYYSLGYTGSLKNDWSYGVKVGHYDYKPQSSGWLGDYTHEQVSLTKSVKKAGDFTLAVDQPSKPCNNGKKDARVSLSWKKSFDF